MEKISVIVPVYNVEKYLERCVNSIINQTYQNLEIILVDDGSKDKSGEICDKLLKKDNRITVIHKTNGGLSSARNAGIKKSTGKYVTFIDSDDFIENNMYEELFNLIKNSKYKIASCSYKKVYDNGKIEKKKDSNEIVQFDFFTAIKEMNTYKYFDMSVCTKLFCRELFDDIIFPEGKLSEDFYIMYKLIEKSNGLTYINKNMYNYFQRTNSITKSTKVNTDFATAAYEQMVYLEEKYPELKAIVRSAYASANLTVYDFYIKNSVKIPVDKKIEIKNNVKENFKYVTESKMFGKLKYMQFVIFLYFGLLYKPIFNIYRKIKN